MGCMGNAYLVFKKLASFFFFFQSGYTNSQQGERDSGSLHSQHQYKALETIKSRQL